MMPVTNQLTELALENMTWYAAPDLANGDAPTGEPIAPAFEAAEDSLLHAWATMQLYGFNSMQTAEGQLQPVQNKTLPERLAALLVDMGAKQGGIIRHLSHQPLAEMLGTQRETISALIRAFHRQELIRVGYRRIEVLDPEALAELAR